MSETFRLWGVRIAGIAACLLCVGCASEREPMPLDSFSPTQTYEAGDSALVVESFVEEVADNNHPKQKKSTKKYRILKVLKDSSGEFEVGAEIKGPLRLPKVAKQCILVHSPDDDPKFEWAAVANFTPAMAEYLQGFPPGKKDEWEPPTAKQCSHLLKHLEHSEKSISKDAYDRIATAEPQVLASLANEFPRKKLIQWVADSKLGEERLPLYWLMLGLCGRREDVPVFEKKLENIKSQKRWHDLDGIGVTMGVTAGYVLLTRDAGFKRLEETNLRVDADSELVQWTLTGLQYARTYVVRSSIPDSSFHHAVILAVDHPVAATHAIALLAEWKVWSVRERLAEKFKKAIKNKDQRELCQAIVSYMQQMSVDPELNPAKGANVAENLSPPHVKFAESFLKEVKQKHPGLADEKLGDQFF